MCSQKASFSSCSFAAACQRQEGHEGKAEVSRQMMRELQLFRRHPERRGLAHHASENVCHAGTGALASRCTLSAEGARGDEEIDGGGG